MKDRKKTFFSNVSRLKFFSIATSPVYERRTVLFALEWIFFSDQSISWPVQMARVGGSYTWSETVEILCSTLILSSFSPLAGVEVTPALRDDMRLSLFSLPLMNVLIPVIVARGI